MEPTQPPQPSNPCYPSPCGANAACSERNGVGACTCLPEYFGDPVSTSECLKKYEFMTMKAFFSILDVALSVSFRQIVLQTKLA